MADKEDRFETMDSATMEELWKSWEGLEERLLNAVQMPEQLEGHYELASMNIRLMNQLIAMLVAVEGQDDDQVSSKRSRLLARCMTQMERAKAVVFNKEKQKYREMDIDRLDSGNTSVTSSVGSGREEDFSLSKDDWIMKISAEKDWDRKDLRDVIEDVIDSNILPIGQIWLRAHAKRKRADWNSLKNLVIKNYVMSKLRSGHLDQALAAIKQLGLDCMQIVLNIFESTNEPSVRNLIAQEIKNQGLMTQHHEVNLMVINLIEHLYDSCHEVLDHLSIDCVSKLKLAEVQLILSKGIFYPLASQAPSHHAGLLVHEHSCSEVSSEVRIIEELRNLVNCESLWRYLVDYTDVKRLELWILNHHRSKEVPTGDNEQTNPPPFPFNSEITDSMINYCHEFGSELIKEALYNCYASIGKWDIFPNVNEILKRFIRFQDIQIEDSSQNAPASFFTFFHLLNQRSSPFNTQLLTYLTENQLFELIYQYGDKFLLTDANQEASAISPLSTILTVIACGKFCESLSSKSVKALSISRSESMEDHTCNMQTQKIERRTASDTSLDNVELVSAEASQLKLNELIFDLIVNAARLVFEQSMTCETTALLDRLIENGQLDIVLVAHEYAKNPRELITPNLLNQLRSHHPVLHRGAVSVLQMESQTKRSKFDPKHLCFYHGASDHTDACFDSKYIYDLLEGSVPVNVARIFAWQSRNLMKLQMGEAFEMASDSGISQACSKDHSQTSDDLLKEMPYFSHPKLASKYGLGVKFSYLYFLIHQRPLDAYLAYLHERKMSPSTAQVIENLAYKKAALLAYTHLKDTRVAASCVIFQELLRGDSFELRLHLSVANFILKYAAVFLDYAERDRETTLGYYLRRAYDKRDKQAATKLLQILAMGFEKKFNREDLVTVDELVEWRLPLAFASFHGLDLPTEFLEKSAKNDHWLHYALFLQMNDIQKEVAIKSLQHFNNACIAEHLEKAFNTSAISDNGSSPNDSSLLIKRGRRMRTSSKDMRKKMLYKMGVVSNPSNLLDQPFRVGNEGGPSSLHPQLLSPSHTPQAQLRSPNSLSPEGEGDSLSIFSDGDTTYAETISVISSSEHSDPTEGFKFDIGTAPKDLFGVLLRATGNSNSEEHWKPLMAASIALSNPALALMAVSLNDSPTPSVVMSGFCCWLLASIEPLMKTEFLSKRNKPQDCLHSWNAEESLALIEAIITKRRYIRLLHLGLEIFTSYSLPSLGLLKFLTDFLIEKNYFKWTESSLKPIVEAFDRFEDDHFWTEATIPWSLFTKNWNLLVAHICIRNTLMLSLNQYEQLSLIHLFSAFDNTLLSDDLFKWRSLHKMLSCIKDTEIEVSIKDLITSKISTDPEEKRFKEWVIGGAKMLQEKLYFEEARKFASSAGIPLYPVIVNEWTLKAKHDQERIEFWQDCWNDFTKHRVPKEKSIKLYYELSEQVESVIIKCFLLSKCFINGSEDIFKHHELSINDIESKFWLAAVEAESHLHFSLPISSSSNSMLEAWNSILEEVIMHLQSHGYPDWLLGGEETQSGSKGKITCDWPRALESLIEKLVRNACLETSIRVCELFNYACQDLEIVQVCHNIAKGIITCKDDIPMQIMYQLDNCDFIASTSGAPFNGREVLQVISKLTFLTTIGRPACNRILTYYKISLLLGSDYTLIANRHDDVSVVKDLMKLALTSPDAVLLIKDLVQLSSMPDEVVAQIICEDFVVQRCLINYKSSEGSSYTLGSSPSLTPSSTSSEPTTNASQVAFYSLMRLLSDGSVLGNKLLSKMSEVVEPEETVELLIKAHECFSMTCDLEGISLILQKTRVFVFNALAPERNYSLMQRLLMGIGRYTEMTYIFDIFRDDHVFERLLGKFTDKVPQLRIALLNYLKSDSEMKKLVALNFSMHREIAEDHQQSAKRQLKRIDALFKKYPQLQYQNDIIRELDMILQNQIDSAISFSKAGCFVSANHCERQAQLISLQIHLIQAQLNIVVLNMDDTQVARFISTHPKFHEAYIVAEAYDHHRSWPNALYNNVVMNDDANYLRNFTSLIELSMDLVEGVANLYAQALSKSHQKEAQLRKGMQRILKVERNIRFKFKMALKLRFADMVNELIQSENGPILKDLDRNSLV